MVNADGSAQNAHTLGNPLMEGGTFTSSAPPDPIYGNFVLNTTGTLSASGTAPFVINAAVFQLNGSRPIIVGTSSLMTIISIIANVMNNNTNPGGITKSGAGRLVLKGSNTYTGGTIIVQGALLADNTEGSATGKGPVSVSNSGALGGTGFISGSTSIGAGGTLEPGFGLSAAGADLRRQ